MSAFIVSRAHIDAIVSLALVGPTGRGPKYPGDGWHGPTWFAEQPDRDSWSIADYSNNRRRADYTEADELGQMLLGECIRSVSARYRDDSIDELPGVIAETATWAADGIESYRYRHPRRRLTAVEGLKAIACLEYQSCEHEQWEASEALRFLEALRRSLINALPGYDDAAWDISSSEVVA